MPQNDTATIDRPVTQAVQRRQDADKLRAYATNRDPRIRDDLVARYMPLAAAIARRFDRGGRVPLDDLKQVAAIGLLKALDRYDPDNGAAFTSYAVPTIEGEIRRHFRDFSWTVRPPRDLQERAIRAERERERLTNELGRSPTADELAVRLDCTTEELMDAIEASHARGAESFDNPSGGSEDEDGGLTLMDRLGKDDPGYERAEAAATIERLLDVVSPRERLMLELRFGEDLTQSEIGRRIGVSQMQVSRILRAALARISEHASSPGTVESPMRQHPQPDAELVLD